MPELTPVSNLPFPRLSITNKTTKKEMVEYISQLEKYAESLVTAHQSMEPLPPGITAVPATDPMAQQKDTTITELQATVNSLQGELNILKGFTATATAVEERLLDKIAPPKRRKS